MLAKLAIPNGVCYAMLNEVDILEDDVVRLGGVELLQALLKDHTKSTASVQHNIIWATDDYAHLGRGFKMKDEIRPELVTGAYNHVVMPRVVKAKERQTARSKDMAEVFTPSWICNAQNNLIDNAWFGREGVFNIENDDHTWKATTGKIDFPEGKTWKDYVRDTRLEITCGEAPYLVSRYDTVSGKAIELTERIGLLDRKLRVVSENTTTHEEWLDAAILALKNTYGYEWQGDNLLLSREAVFFSFLDYYRDKFSDTLPQDVLLQVADIVSWNLWQMDGLKMVVPMSCYAKEVKPDAIQQDLFDPTPVTEEKKVMLCEGCAKGNIHAHNGLYCKIMDWEKNKPIEFRSLLKS